MALFGRNAPIGLSDVPAGPYRAEWDEVGPGPLYTARRLRVPPGREAPQPLQRTAVMQP